MTGAGELRIGVEVADGGRQTLIVDIRFYGMIRDVVGEARLTARLPADCTVADLLNSLIAQYGERFRQRVMESPDRLSRFVELIVNGCQVERTALDTRLARADGMQPAAVNVLVLPPSAGG